MLFSRRPWVVGLTLSRAQHDNIIYALLIVTVRSTVYITLLLILEYIVISNYICDVATIIPEQDELGAVCVTDFGFFVGLKKKKFK